MWHAAIRLISLSLLDVAAAADDVDVAVDSDANIVDDAQRTSCRCPRKSCS